MPELWRWTELVLEQAALLRWQEWVSTLAQIASVAYARKNNVLVYPTGLVGVALAFWLYLFVASPPLYADAVLNIYYFIMSLVGWYNWTRINHEKQAVFQVRYCSAKEISAGIAVMALSWIAIWLILSQFTDSNTPLMDALVTATAVTAMWWMALRRVENWYMWICSNLVAIPLNYYKGFIIFTFMYLIFLYMSIQGAREWHKTAHSGR